MLVVFLSIFVEDTKIICSDNFVAPLKHLLRKAHTLHSSFKLFFLQSYYVEFCSSFTKFTVHPLNHSEMGIVAEHFGNCIKF